MSTATQNSRWMTKWMIWGTGLFVVLALLANGLFNGTLGQIGPDNDDVMRLLQVRDFFQGQSWFDVTQYRMGLEGGTAMHWSRLPDIPLIILTGLFNLFLPYAAAESIAITIWPPLCFLIVFYGLVRGLGFVGGKYTLPAGLILTTFIFAGSYRFYPGAIDHHNIQLGLLALAVGFAIDPKLRARSYAISGLACAASIAIGTEVAVFIGIICGFFAVSWLLSGAKAKSGTMAFGFALALGLIVIFIGTVAPENYAKVYCDALSPMMVGAGALGGVGLAGIAYLLSEKAMIWRLAALGILGAACLALFLTQAPQCLSNPLNDLPPVVQTLWLDEVMEAQNIWDIRHKWLSDIPYMMGMQVTALLVTIGLLVRGEDKRAFGLCLALIISALAFSLYQVRFYLFGFLFAIVPLAYWIGGLYAKRTENPDKASLAHILALAISLPYVWSIGSVFTGDAGLETKAPKGETQTLSGDCFSDTIIHQLSKLPKGVILAVPNGGAQIIEATPHRALNGNYHRNAAGIQTSLEIYTSPSAAAQTMLAKHKVNYIHVCNAHADSINYKNYAPGGLMSDLLAGRIPDYLASVSGFEGGNVLIYRVK